MIRRAEKREGGLGGLQRAALPLLLAAFEVPPAAKYVAASLHWHVRQARQRDSPLYDDGLLMRALAHESMEVCKQAVLGVGIAELQAEISTLGTKERWWEAAQLWFSASCLHEASSAAHR